MLSLEKYMNEEKKAAAGYGLLFILFLVCLMLSITFGMTGCKTAEPIIKTEYEIVEVPVPGEQQQLPVPTEPDRPVRTKEQTPKEILILAEQYIKELIAELRYSINIITASNESGKR